MQSFTAHMPLLMATSAFELQRKCWSSPQQCYLYCLCMLPPANVEMNLKSAQMMESNKIFLPASSLAKFKKTESKTKTRHNMKILQTKVQNNHKN